MITQDNAVQAYAERAVEAARDYGQSVGLTREAAAVDVLERALAFAYAEVALFRGANDTFERREETVRIATGRLTVEIHRQALLMRGHRALELPRK